MPVDMSISRWVNVVAARQWTGEDQALRSMGDAVPETVLQSRPLTEVHRLDLALFIVFEDAALRVSGALTRRAPSLDALNFSAQQTLDEARHHEVFLRRLMATAPDRPVEELREAILIPPLRRFLERAYEVADAGSFVEGLTLVNLVLEGMAYPLYSYEQRYWSPVDPYLAELIGNAFADETRHIAFGANLVNAFLADDPARRASVRAMCHEARALMGEIFDYYIKKFVGLFDAVSRRHRDLFAAAEFVPGKLISQTPYAEQVSTIRASIDAEHSQLLQRAGLD